MRSIQAQVGEDTGPGRLMDRGGPWEGGFDIEMSSISVMLELYSSITNKSQRFIPAVTAGP